MKHIFPYFFLLFISFSINAQVQPPGLLCVKSDTLVWDIPNNSCGSFNSYTIYISDSFNGPYSILANIFDPLQTSYFHDSANNMTWYYYMTTDANCPGQPVLSSDTLDSTPPDISPIIYTDIQNGKVVLEWTESLSPEVIGYIVYRSTDIGTVPIDTVTTLTYCDLGSDPNTQPENYYVLALDACGNTSLITNPHRTVLVKGEVQSCDQSISLTWNRYEGWQAIDRQEIWASTNGDVPILLQTLSDTDTSTVVSDLIDETNYCFFVESYDAVTGANSTSNEICLNIDIIASVRFLEMKNVSVVANNNVVVTWQWNQDAELSDYSILSATNTSDFQTIETLVPPLSLPLNNNYTDENAMPEASPVSYQISSTDECGDMVTSNIGTSVHLSGQAISNNLENQINWTSFSLDNAIVNRYEIFRVGENNTVNIATVEEDVFVLLDPVDPAVSADAQVCYYVEAVSTISLTSGAEEIIRSRSNVVCIEQPTGILAPNAFAPAGVNYEFRPLLIFGEGTDYQMTIWDRWGQQIFESTDINTGWTGRKGFHEYPMGVYNYRIKVTQPSGREVEEIGVLTLVR